MDNETKTAREMVRSENEMMNHRITWLLVIQGLLFTAFGTIFDKNSDRPENISVAFLTFVIPTLGIFVSMISYVGLFCTKKAITRLHDLYPSSCPGIVGYWANSDPDLPKGGRWIIQYVSPWVALPNVFVLAWMLILIPIAWPFSWGKLILVIPVVVLGGLVYVLKYLLNPAAAVRGDRAS